VSECRYDQLAATPPFELHRIFATSPVGGG
jgi:hypothetical protein